MGEATTFDLQDIPLKRVTDETSPLPTQTVKAGSLWAGKGAIVFVVRRPGCHLCREEGLDLSGLLPTLDEPRPRLVAVIAERTSSGDFISRYFQGGEVYLDEERYFMKSLGDRWMGLMGLLNPKVWKNGKRATNKYPELNGDLKGEGRRLGGLYVIGPDSKVHMQYKESIFGDHADLKDVAAAVKKMQLGN